MTLYIPNHVKVDLIFGQVIYLSASMAQALQAKGAIETNPSARDAEDNIASRATPNGINWLNSLQEIEVNGEEMWVEDGEEAERALPLVQMDESPESPDALSEALAAPVIADAVSKKAPVNRIKPVSIIAELVIEDGVDMPNIKRSIARNSAFPTGILEVGQSFFLPTSDVYPDPAKKLQTLASAEVSRTSVLIPGETRTDRNGKIVPAKKATKEFMVRSVESGGIAGARIKRIA